MLLAVAVGLAGCNPSEPEPQATASSAHTAARTARATQARADMVTAVSASTEPGPAELRFAIRTRPRVGEPFDIQFAITPTEPLERLLARFQASEGLELVRGAETEHFDNPAPGTQIEHTVTVIPKEDGIFYVSAVVLTDSATQSLARSYAVPIIAGEGLRDPKTSSPAAAASASRTEGAAEK